MADLQTQLRVSDDFCVKFCILGLASTYPEPSDKKAWIREHLYNFSYESAMPVTWPWPEAPQVKTRDLIPTKLY